MMVDRRNTVSFLGLVAFSWTIPLLHASRANDNLSVHDLPELGYCSRAVNLFSSFLEAGEEYEAHRLWLTIFKSHAWSLVAQILLSLTSSFCIFLPRLALLGILQTLDTSVHQNSLRLWLYVAALGTTSVVSNTVTTWKYWTSVNIISMRVYAQLASVIYHKGLRLSGASAHDGYNADNTGDASQITINAVANDAKGIAGFVGDSYQLLETPIKLVCCCIFLLRLLGWQSVLAGLAIVFLCGPAQGYIAKWTVSTTISMLDCRDRRMSLVSELIQGIRQVKFLAAEEGWEERINRLRDREVNAASRTIRCNVFLSSIYLAEPILLAVVMLSMYSVTHPSPSASTAFTSITILSVMEQALDTLPALQMRLVNVVLFARRIEEYLQRPERVPFIVRSDRIELENATIVWPGSTTGLFDVSLQFPPGELSIISGPTGAGKSLLLSCLVGECELIGGTVFAPTGSDHPLRQPGHKWLVDDAVAYVAQSAWIETGTLRDNILFGCPYLPQRYEEVLFACALYPDIRLFPDGDRTEVGGNGVNLSGGQRSRLSLARALYSRAQTLIMDDIFSAVDVHTAKHLYEFALTGTLALGRTRILATYQVELCLSKAAYLVTLDKQGGCKGMPVTESQRAEAFSPDGTEEACFQPHDSGDGVPSAEGNLSERIFLDDYQSIRDTLLSRCDETSCCHAEMTRLSVASGGQVGSVQLKTMKDFFRLSGGVWHWTFVLSLFTVYGCLTLGRVSESVTFPL
jgi:ABC-type multidrug transport system fused ATPase/permease subunit